MAPRALLAAALAFAAISCARAEPPLVALPEPVVIPAAPPPDTGGMVPRPSAEPVAEAPPEPAWEPPIDPATVEVPPLDPETKDALAAFVAVQRSIAAEHGTELHGPDRYDLLISPRARTVLPSLKRASREAARRVIGAGLAAGQRAPKVLAIQVTKAFIAAGAAVDDAENRGGAQSIGMLERIEVDRPAGHPSKLGVVITVSLPCGSDGSLYVLQEQPRGAPSVLLAGEANGYSSIMSGQLALTYHLSLPDERGGWFAVVASSSSWCSSAWRGIEYSVLVPGASPDAPRRVLRQHDSAYLGESLCEMDAGRDDFRVDYTTWDRFGDRVMRPAIHHYARRLGAFVRVQPIATQPIELPREWVMMPWDEARRFVAGPDPDALRPWHEKLVRGEKAERAMLAMKSEDLAAGTARLSLTCAGCKTLPAELLIDVRKDGPGWVMVGVSAP